MDEFDFAEQIRLNVFIEEQDAAARLEEEQKAAIEKEKAAIEKVKANTAATLNYFVKKMNENK